MPDVPERDHIADLFCPCSPRIMLSPRLCGCMDYALWHHIADQEPHDEARQVTLFMTHLDAERHSRCWRCTTKEASRDVTSPSTPDN